MGICFGEEMIVCFSVKFIDYFRPDFDFRCEYSEQMFYLILLIKTFVCFVNLMVESVMCVKPLNVYLNYFFDFAVGETSMNFLAMNFNVSSKNMTGNEIFNTAHHSNIVSGHTENTTERMST
jgi:hypothetical protein